MGTGPNGFGYSRSEIEEKMQKNVRRGPLSVAKLTGTCGDGPGLESCLDTIPRTVWKGVRAGVFCGIRNQLGAGTATKEPLHHMCSVVLAKQQKKLRFGRITWQSGCAEAKHTSSRMNPKDLYTIRRFGRLAWRSGFAEAKHTSWGKNPYDSAIRAASVAIWIC